MLHVTERHAPILIPMNQNDAYLRVFNHPKANPQGAIVASMPAGSFFGALTVAYLADRIGRKNTIILSGIIWVIGSILQSAAQVQPYLHNT